MNLEEWPDVWKDDEQLLLRQKRKRRFPERGLAPQPLAAVLGNAAGALRFPVPPEPDDDRRLAAADHHSFCTCILAIGNAYEV